MDKEIKQKWLDALRSGEYQQGRSYLNKDGEFCCLGVLADVIDPNGWADREGYGLKHVGNYDEHEDYLNPDFCGISLIMQERLADMNDGGDNFHIIAAYIQENL